MDFAVQVDHRVKLKECEMRDKYLHLTKELKKLYNIKVTIIPIVVGALGGVTKGFVQGLENLEIRGRVETVQITALLRSARILRRVLEMTMHKALHLRNDIDRLYVSRKEGGRGLSSIEDSVDASIQRHEDYIKKKMKEDSLQPPKPILITRWRTEWQ